jgi:addiction module RelB/DinJ family antitoxin
MTTVQIATRIDAEEKKLFEETTRALGLTPADALRVFIKAFDKEGGFPFVPTVSRKNEEYIPKYTPEQRRRIIEKWKKSPKVKHSVARYDEDKKAFVLPASSMPEPELREAWIYERV